MIEIHTDEPFQSLAKGLRCYTSSKAYPFKSHRRRLKMEGAIRRPDTPNHFMVLKPINGRIVVRFPGEQNWLKQRMRHEFWKRERRYMNRLFICPSAICWKRLRNRETQPIVHSRAMLTTSRLKMDMKHRWILLGVTNSRLVSRRK